MPMASGMSPRVVLVASEVDICVFTADIAEGKGVCVGTDRGSL